jgi:hypothetical protein
VKGDTRYIKIQKPGRAVGGTRTLITKGDWLVLSALPMLEEDLRSYPQKTRQREKMRLARLAPVSAVSMAAMHMWANVLVKIRNDTMRSHISPPRSVTASVASAFFHKPIYKFESG